MPSQVRVSFVWALPHSAPRRPNAKKWASLLVVILQISHSSDVISELTLKCFWRDGNRGTREIYLEVATGPRHGNIEVIRERGGPEPQVVLNKGQMLMQHVKELTWGNVRVLGEVLRV